jgi:hypothetical protein
MSGTPNQSTGDRPLTVLSAVVCAALPATFFTFMADSITVPAIIRGSIGPLLYLSVLLGPSLLGCLTFVASRRIDPASGNALGTAVSVSLGASVTAFVVAFVFFLN